MAEIWPPKSETHCIKLTVAVNLINFPGDVTTPTAGFTTAKLIFNSVYWKRMKKIMRADIAYLYLNNCMDRYEYMKLPLDIIPD